MCVVSQSRKPIRKTANYVLHKCSGCGRCRNVTEKDADFKCFNDAKEICGKEYTSDEVLNEVLKYKVFFVFQR